MSEEVHQQKRPWRRHPVAWICGAVLVALLSTVIIGRWQAVKRVDRELERLRANGWPVDFGELELYYARPQGRRPSALSELVPKFLDSIPEDPFSDLPMKYRSTPHGFIAYSVGVDGVDDGGDKPRSPTPASPAVDITFEVRRPGSP